MKIFELLNQPEPQSSQPEQDDDEDDQGKFDAGKVDQNLQDISQQVDDQQAQPAQPNEPPPPELDDMNVKPIDSALLSQIRSLPYTKKYVFDDESSLNPIKISSMQVEELSSLLSKTRYKMQLIMMRDQIGTDDNKNMEFCSDLIQFINAVMKFKKTNTSAQLQQFRSAPPYQPQQ
jgi:hypothetical protein